VPIERGVGTPRITNQVPIERGVGSPGWTNQGTTSDVSCTSDKQPKGPSDDVCTYGPLRAKASGSATARNQVSADSPATEDKVRPIGTTARLPSNGQPPVTDRETTALPNGSFSQAIVTEGEAKALDSGLGATMTEGETTRHSDRRSDCEAKAIISVEFTPRSALDKKAGRVAQECDKVSVGKNCIRKHRAGPGPDWLATCRENSETAQAAKAHRKANRTAIGDGDGDRPSTRPPKKFRLDDFSIRPFELDDRDLRDLELGKCDVAKSVDLHGCDAPALSPDPLRLSEVNGSVSHACLSETVTGQPNHSEGVRVATRIRVDIDPSRWVRRRLSVKTTPGAG
jgi:hypothetical protein